MQRDWTPEQLIELLLLTGQHRTVSYFTYVMEPIDQSDNELLPISPRNFYQ